MKNLPAVQETQVQSLVWEDLLEKGMATHSSILAWRIPWTQEPGELSIHEAAKSQARPNTVTYGVSKRGTMDKDNFTLHVLLSGLLDFSSKCIELFYNE